MYSRLFSSIFIFCVYSLSAQYDPLPMAYKYRSTDNPYYWKNKMPFPGYWQQDVHYTINAEINEQTDIITASEELLYFNNSPDTLYFVYFHLYQNAFLPGSYSDELYKANDYPVRYGKYESQKLGTVVENLKVDGKEVKTELDNTILKVWLPAPLLPGGEVNFTMSFKTYFDYGGNVRRRMRLYGAYGNKHYNGTQWYPRISVYDRKFGWDTNQHLGKEFYGDFGTYDVSLTFSDNYVVEATGNLINREEVLPKELRDRLDIKNFANDSNWEKPPSIITPYDPKKRKTWKYHAENVHDFAWTADPTYRIGEAEWNGIKAIAVVQEPHASRWQNAASYTAKILEVYSKDFGMYVYDKIVVADASDGMEYPMLALCNGSEPGYRSVIAHEVGHNWYFGIVGSNETYRAAMDEGFTQLLNAWSMEKIEGPYELRGKFTDNYTEKHKDDELVRYKRVYMGYIRDAIKGDETTLNTHSDDFDGALAHGGGYGNVYYKMSTMLYNLQYVLGDSLFSAAMKNYFNEWKIAHPYFEDFKTSIIHFTKTDLNWFFDQWFETSKTIDYKVGRVKNNKGGNYAITFIRKGGMQMPLDFSVYDKEGKRHDYYIPNTWFAKSGEAKVLPRWIGWGKLKPQYVASVNIPAGIDDVVIDTTNRLADINMLDNKRKMPSILKFDSRVSNFPDWKNYELFARPDLWYNFYDGIKVGLHVNGNYMNYKHVFDVTVWLNSGLQKMAVTDEKSPNSYNPFSVKASYATPTNGMIKGSSFNISGRYLDGLVAGQTGMNFSNRKGTSTLYAYFKALYRPDSTDINYLIYRDQWNSRHWNNTLNIGVLHRYDYKRGEGRINLNMRTSALASDYEYSQLSLEVVNKNVLGKFNFNTRVFAQIGTGDNVAPESALYLAGGNPESMMESKFTRSVAFFPQSWNGFGNTINHFHAGGGLGLRGYAGYLVPHLRDDGIVLPAYRGNSGASLSAELEFDRLFKIRPRFTRNWLKINTYLFGDAGILNANLPGEKTSFADPRADAGVGMALTIKKWGPFTKEKPLTLRFDVPLLLTRTPDVSPDYVQFRWVVGVNRAF